MRRAKVFDLANGQLCQPEAVVGPRADTHRPGTLWWMVKTPMHLVGNPESMLLPCARRHSSKVCCRSRLPLSQLYLAPSSSGHVPGRGSRGDHSATKCSAGTASFRSEVITAAVQETLNVPHAACCQWEQLYAGEERMLYGTDDQCSPRCADKGCRKQRVILP